MQRRVFLTRLKPEARSQYVEAHRDVSDDLRRRYAAAGFSSCAVYILDDMLVLVTEAEDHERTAALLAEDPVEQGWQDYVRPMKADGDYQLMSELFRIDL